MMSDAMVLAVTMKDGTVHDKLTINNHALVMYDLERARRHWPAGQDAPFLWVTFLAWQQLVDQDDYPATVSGDRPGKSVPSFDRFMAQDCEDVDRLAAVDVDPTQAAAESGPVSASPPQPE